jgi:hypothetical protein
MAIWGFIAMFRGARRAGDAVATWMFPEIVTEELGSSEEQRKGAVAKKTVVGSESIVFPEMESEPTATEGPEPNSWVTIYGSGISPEVGIVVGNPTAAAIEALGYIFSCLCETADEVEEGKLAFDEVGRTGEPVVHLQVDVDGVLAFPRWRHLLVPDALEVGWKGARTT